MTFFVYRKELIFVAFYELYIVCLTLCVCVCIILNQFLLLYDFENWSERYDNWISFPAIQKWVSFKYWLFICIIVWMTISIILKFKEVWENLIKCKKIISSGHPYQALISLYITWHFYLNFLDEVKNVTFSCHVGYKTHFHYKWWLSVSPFSPNSILQGKKEFSFYKRNSSKTMEDVEKRWKFLF